MPTELPPGPELDRLVCEKLGIEALELRGNHLFYPHVSEWRDMRLVIEAMEKRGYGATLQTRSNGWRAVFHERKGAFPRTYGASASTLPHAVCLAALTALEGEE